jgi:K+-transporting ATPase c subunit
MAFIAIVTGYAVFRLHDVLPFNEGGIPPMSPDLAFNTSVSFETNTNWQNYSGETGATYLTQAAVLAVRNFTSAATGLAVAIALIRGLTGLDPAISPAAAEYQIARVAAARGLADADVRAAVARHADGQLLGFLGEPRVNVLLLNLDLDGLLP